MIASVISVEEGMTRTNTNMALRRALPCIYSILFHNFWVSVKL